jgi:RimJ/RimL family protein N-acetyltransferase
MASRSSVLETERLRIRHFGLDDAPFVLELINDPDWHRFIGDRGIRTLEGARGYVEKNLMGLYERLGFGLDLVELKDGTPVGMCGLIKRETLEHVDLGFAFMPSWRGKGYAYESALAVRDYATGELGLERLVAITSPDNDASGKLLVRLGFEYRETIPFGTEGDVSKLYAYDPQPL